MNTKIIGLCGSLRKASRNLSVLRSAQKIAKQLGAELDIAELSAIPLYNQDIQDQGMPITVTALADQIRNADAIVFVSPEYNYSLPGVLKNTIDWLSRVPEQPFAGKACAIMGTSPGAAGTARMQYHLRQILVCLDAHPLNKPEVMIGSYHSKFNEQGELTDAKALEMIERQLTSLIKWAAQLSCTTE